MLLLRESHLFWVGNLDWSLLLRWNRIMVTCFPSYFLRRPWWSWKMKSVRFTHCPIFSLLLLFHQRSGHPSCYNGCTPLRTGSRRWRSRFNGNFLIKCNPGVLSIRVRFLILVESDEELLGMAPYLCCRSGGYILLYLDPTLSMYFQCYTPKSC